LPCAERLKRGSLDAGDLGPPAAGQLDHQVCSSQACRISQYLWTALENWAVPAFEK